MQLINNLKCIKHIIENHHFCLLYIQAPDCGLCSVMLSKIEQVSQQYKHLQAVRVELHEVPELASAFLVATAPTVLVFVNSKEVYRAGTFIDVLELERILSRWSDNLTL